MSIVLGLLDAPSYISLQIYKTHRRIYAFGFSFNNALSQNNIMQHWHMHKCDTEDSTYTFLLSKENAELCNSIFHKCLFHQVARIS